MAITSSGGKKYGASSEIEKLLKFVCESSFGEEREGVKARENEPEPEVGAMIPTMLVLSLSIMHFTTSRFSMYHLRSTVSDSGNAIILMK